MKVKSFPISTRFVGQPTIIFREGEGSPEPTPTPTPTPTPQPTPTPTPAPTPQDKVFTQTELNRIVAEQKRALQQKNTELAAQLQAAVDSGRLSDEEKRQHEARIEELQTEFRTKEEQAQISLKEWETKYNKDTGRLKEKAETWEKRFNDLLIENQLLESASKFKAFNPGQVVKLLRDQARRVEDLEEGKPTGRFSVKVKFTGEREGKPVQLDLTPEETIKMMTEMPSVYGNLFISAATGGLGGSNGNSSQRGLPDLSSMSMEDYAKNRGRILDAVSAANKESQ